MMQYFGRDERYWRTRAQELRLAAASMPDPVEKSMLQRMATAYEKLADLAKSFSDADPSKSRPDD
jgi:hypothetical protein